MGYKLSDALEEVKNKTDFKDNVEKFREKFGGLFDETEKPFDDTSLYENLAELFKNNSHWKALMAKQIKETNKTTDSIKREFGKLISGDLKQKLYSSLCKEFRVKNGIILLKRMKSYNPTLSDLYKMTVGQELDNFLKRQGLNFKDKTENMRLFRTMFCFAEMLIYVECILEYYCDEYQININDNDTVLKTKDGVYVSDT